MSQDQDKFIVRFPDGMRDQIKAAAVARGRSMNAEIVYRLSASFEQLSDEEKILLWMRHREEAQAALAQLRQMREEGA